MKLRQNFNSKRNIYVEIPSDNSELEIEETDEEINDLEEVLNDSSESSSDATPSNLTQQKKLEKLEKAKEWKHNPSFIPKATEFKGKPQLFKNFMIKNFKELKTYLEFFKYFSRDEILNHIVIK